MLEALRDDSSSAQRLGCVVRTKNESNYNICMEPMEGRMHKPSNKGTHHLNCPCQQPITAWQCCAATSLTTTAGFAASCPCDKQKTRSAAVPGSAKTQALRQSWSVGNVTEVKQRIACIRHLQHDHPKTKHYWNFINPPTYKALEMLLQLNYHTATGASFS
jgi:hypothetical protein